MPSHYVVWVERSTVVFGNSVGETVLVGDVQDVTDWQEAIVQVGVMASTATTSNDVRWNLETCSFADNNPFWESVLTADQPLSKTPGTSVVFRIVAGDPAVRLPMRRWLRVFLTHYSSTASQSVTIQVQLQLKERVL